MLPSANFDCTLLWNLLSLFRSLSAVFVISRCRSRLCRHLAGASCLLQRIADSRDLYRLGFWRLMVSGCLRSLSCILDTQERVAANWVARRSWSGLHSGDQRGDVCLLRHRVYRQVAHALVHRDPHSSHAQRHSIRAFRSPIPDNSDCGSRFCRRIIACGHKCGADVLLRCFRVLFRHYER